MTAVPPPLGFGNSRDSDQFSNEMATAELTPCGLRQRQKSASQVPWARQRKTPPTSVCVNLRRSAATAVSPEAHSGSCPSAGGGIEEVVGTSLKGLAVASVLTQVFHVGLLHWRILPCAPFMLA